MYCAMNIIKNLKIDNMKCIVCGYTINEKGCCPICGWYPNIVFSDVVVKEGSKDSK